MFSWLYINILDIKKKKTTNTLQWISQLEEFW